jgi:hypothetical protein
VENNGKLCGIVKPNQLKENKHYHPLKKFALALLLVFGSTVFIISCDTGFNFHEFQNQAYVELTNGESHSVVKGFVYHAGSPIVDAEVSFNSGDIIYTAKTDSKGAFELNLPETQLTEIELVVKSQGYEAVIKMIALKGTQVFAGKINLEKAAIECTKGEVEMTMGKIAPPKPVEVFEAGEIAPPIHKTGIVATPRIEKGDVGESKVDSEFD